MCLAIDSDDHGKRYGALNSLRFSAVRIVWLRSMKRTRRLYRGVLERVDYFSIVGAFKVRGVVGIARTFIGCRLRIRAERARHGYAFLRLIIDELGCDELVRRGSLFHPALQRQADIMVSVSGRSKLSKRVGAGAAAAVLQARNHKEPHEKCRLARTKGLFNAVVIIDGGLRRQSGIAPAVIDNELSTTRGKRLQVRINGIEGLALLVIRQFHRGFNADAFQIDRL